MGETTAFVEGGSMTLTVRHFFQRGGQLLPETAELRYAAKLQRSVYSLAFAGAMKEGFVVMNGDV